MSSLRLVKPSSGSRPVGVDLFAGAGGLSLGLEQAGFEIGVAVERAPGPAATYRYNFPATPLLRRDVRWLRASHVRATIRNGFKARGLQWSGEVALVAGGPPCQGYSTGGTSTKNDERNALIHHFRRLVIALESRYFVMENVPGLLFRTHADSLNALREAFMRDGYEIADPCVVDASSLGLPQVRHRVLLFGWRSGETRIDAEALLRTEKQGVCVEEAIGDLPPIESIAALTDCDSYLLPISDDTPRSAYAKGMRERAVGEAEPRDWDGRTLTGCNRTQHDAKIVRRFGATLPGEIERISRYRRLKPDGLAPTLRAGTGPDHGSHTSPRPIHYRAPRVISVREAARLQSFPDWFRFDDAKWHAWQEIGNAVPPLLARTVGEFIRDAIEAGSRRQSANATPKCTESRLSA